VKNQCICNPLCPQKHKSKKIPPTLINLPRKSKSEEEPPDPNPNPHPTQDQEEASSEATLETELTKSSAQLEESKASPKALPSKSEEPPKTHTLESKLVFRIKEKKGEDLCQLRLKLSISKSKIKKGNVYLLVNQMIGQNRRFLYRSESIDRSSTKQNPVSPNIDFEPILFFSDMFEGNWQNKVLLFEFYHKKKLTEIKNDLLVHKILDFQTIFGTQSAGKPQGEYAEMTVEKSSDSRKLGKILIQEAQVEPVLTFADLLFSGVRFIPVLAVDFSLGNLTFDSQKCVHHLSKSKPNSYVFLMNLIWQLIAPFCKDKIAGYGFGAKWIPKKGNTLDGFALNGDFENPFVDNVDSLIEEYRNCLKKVEISLPVNFRRIIRLARNMARNHMHSSKQPKSYYVLYILTAGVIDDFEESLHELMKCVDLPLSIVIVKVGNIQMTDVNDIFELKKHCIEKCNQINNEHRRFISCVDFQSCLPYMGQYEREESSDQIDRFAYKLIGSIPPQMLVFFKQVKRKANAQTPDGYEEQVEQIQQIEQKHFEEEKKDSIGSQKEVNEKAKERKEDEESKVSENPNIADRLQFFIPEYFSKLKISFIKKLKEAEISDEDIELLLKQKLPEDEIHLAQLTLARIKQNS
jgi:hypothetical protein